MPFPSDHLRSVLAELQLCTPADLDALSRHVRPPGDEVPDFDLCWLDVLVTHRFLTPWQANQLQSDDPWSLVKGGFRLREPLGRHTWLAETPDRRTPVVFCRIGSSETRPPQEQLTRGQGIIDRIPDLADGRTGGVCLPKQVLQDDQGDIWLISPWVAGWSAEELLIRGGRMPWQAVQEIGRTLLNGLTVLERLQLVHGSISLNHLRLTRHGQAVLVDPFSASLRDPAATFRSDQQLRHVRHCAPERVGTGRACDAVSDLYSLGTVLWQLLTARPTFLSADPVRFLMHCRSEDVADVREWVPDCPASLAEAIRQMTRRHPDLRPQSMAEARDRWPGPERRRCPHTRRLVRQLPERNHRPRPPHRPCRQRRLLQAGWAAAAVTGIALVGLTAGVVPLPLTMPHRASLEPTETDAAASDAAAVPAAANDTLLVLPEPDADGLVTLISGRTYHPVPIQSPGRLQIRTTGEAPAAIAIRDGSPWTVTADEIQMSGVHLTGTADSSTLLHLNAAIVVLDRCRFECTDASGTGLTWTPSGSGSTVGQVHNCIFSGGRQGIRTATPPDRMELHNTLFYRTAAAWRCSVSRRSQVTVHLDRVTQFLGRSFLDITWTSDTRSLTAEITCGHSVLAPTDALIRIASTAPDRTGIPVTVGFFLAGRSDPSIIPSGVSTAVQLDRSLGYLVELPPDQQLIEGLLVADPQFGSAADDDRPFADAILRDFDGPKLSTRLPGIDFDRLPVTYESDPAEPVR